MKLLIQGIRPFEDTSGKIYGLAAGEFRTDGENSTLMADTAFGTFIINRAKLLCAVALPEEFDISTFPENVMKL